MFAITAADADADDPLAALALGEAPEPAVPDGWEVVEVRAASLNHHDLWTLRGVGIAEDALPMVLGCDAAGVTADGREVIVHAVVAADGGPGVDLDRPFSILSERHPGTHAERVAVPAGNLVDKPAELSFAEAACLPTAWLTAYRMLFVRGGARPGDRVLVQGAGGGVATAAIVLGRAAGLTVWVTSRDEAKLERARALGAHAGFETGARLPDRVDLVLETVGKATWGHSLRAVRQGGAVVVCGATTGWDPSAELNRVYFRQLRIIGSTMGTRDELAGLVRMLVASGARPVVDATYDLPDGRRAYERLAAGDVFGKLVLTTG
jgi:NADPH:quinone reductase-like Zn-dependent oxidoreductase